MRPCSLRAQQLKMCIFVIAADIFRGQRLLGEFVPSRRLDVQAFAGGEDLSAETGAVGGVVRDEKSLAVLRDDGRDIHLACFGDVLTAFAMAW